MSSPSRSVLLAAAAAAALLAAACASSPASPRGCQSREQCASDARCVAGACVANSPPSAAIALPDGPIEATRLLAFDGSSSDDPDPGDAIASHGWAFRAISAPCGPPVVAGTGPAAAVRFACAGRFGVELSVADRLGATASATREFDVAAYSGSPLLTLGPDVVVGHRCADRRCTTTDEVALAATPTAAAPEGLSLAWTVEPPPGRALNEHRRVTFHPGPDAPAPTVLIETEAAGADVTAQAISGDWIFHVEARDGAGVVASGAVRVSVANSRPVLVRTIAPAPHRFEGARFVASGAIPYTLSDPDGDELLPPALEFRHAGDGPGATFGGGIADGPSVRFDIAVPYAAPGDALHLRGGADLERSILFSASDANGGAVSETWPISVTNHPPALFAVAPARIVDHAFDASASAYVAAVPAFTWVDEEGDPLVLAPGSSTGDEACAALEFGANGVATVRCSVPFRGTPAPSALVGVHSVTATMQDPWDIATAASTQFTIRNRAPLIVMDQVVIHTKCRVLYDDCCKTQRNGETHELECVAWNMKYDAAAAVVAQRWVDDDGDPLAVSVNDAGAVTSAVCTPGTCSMPFHFGGDLVCNEGGTSPPSLSFEVNASDGLAAAPAASIPVLVKCDG